MRHLLEVTDLSSEEFTRILARGREHRNNRTLAPAALAGRSVALMFEKSSTRTRLSFSVAIAELGGNVVPLEAGTSHLGRGESIEDTTEVLGRYVHAVMVRAYSHRSVEKMAALNRIPVINGLTDTHHPCQALADWMTIEQYGLKPGPGLVVAFVGEGNNVFNSLALGAVFSGTEMRLAAPAGYEVKEDIKAALAKSGVRLKITRDPVEAVTGAHVVYTDTWVSMGQESETEARRRIFLPYCVTLDLVKHAAPGHLVMHCLPAHHGEEITTDVMKKYSAHIFDQAENRMHVQKAVLEWIFGLL